MINTYKILSQNLKYRITGDLCNSWRSMLNVSLGNKVWKCQLHLTGSAEGPVLSFCEHILVPWRQGISWQSNYHIFKTMQDLVPWIFVPNIAEHRKFKKDQSLLA
jgi:hypothetical protein